MNKFRAVAAAALVGALSVGTAVSASAAVAAEPAAPAASVAQIPVVLDVTPQNWSQVKTWSGERPMMVMYTATWCGPCQKIKPTLKRMATADNGKWTLALFDVDRNRGAVPGQVRAYPTIAALKSGQVSAFYQGPRGESDVRSWISRNLVR